MTIKMLMMIQKIFDPPLGGRTSHEVVTLYHDVGSAGTPPLVGCSSWSSAFCSPGSLRGGDIPVRNKLK